MTPSVASDERFGLRLRHERERRQISLTSIAENTKISAALLEGLERDDVSRWPSGIFRRSFVRAYATAIGIDPDATAREFLSRFPDPAEVPVAAPVQPTSEAARPPRDTALRLTLEDTSGTFTGGPFRAAVGQRCAAVACDLAVIAILGLSLFVVLGVFWTPLAVSMLIYYVGGILLLGNTPGICLSASVLKEQKSKHLRLLKTCLSPRSTRRAPPRRPRESPSLPNDPRRASRT